MRPLTIGRHRTIQTRGCLLTDHRTTENSRHLQVVTLLVLTPVGGFLSLAVWFVGNIADQIDSEASVLFYFVAVLLSVVPALWLIVATISLSRITQQRKGIKISALVMAAACLTLCGVVTGPLIADPIGDAIDLAIEQSEPPTEAELAYTPSELERAVEETVAGSLADIPQAHDEPAIYADACRLSNRTNGVVYTSTVRIKLDIQSLTRWDEARDPIADNWARMGFTIKPMSYPTNDIETSGGSIERMTFDEVGPYAYLTVGTVCVDGTAR